MRSRVFGSNAEYSIGAARASFLLDDAIPDKSVVSEPLIVDNVYYGFTVAFPGTLFLLSVIIPLDFLANQTVMKQDTLAFCPFAETLLVTSEKKRPVYDAALGYKGPLHFGLPFKSVVREYLRLQAALTK